MILSSPGYLTFLVVVYLVFWLLRKNRLAALGVILLANYFFYAKWSLIYLALIPIASTIDYLVALALERVKGAVSRRALVSVSVLMNVALIASARYAPLLNGVKLEVTRADLGARGIYYRVRVPAASQAGAAQFCASVRANGGDCVAM